MNKFASRWLQLPACIAAAAVALAADSNIGVTQSNIIATFRQENVSVDAPFRKFSGTIVYDAAKPGTTSAVIAVDMASLDIGDDETSAEVRKPAWFDSAHYPQATFQSTAIKPGAAGHFDAAGTLTIKGRVQNITVPIAVQRVGNANALDGSFDLSRKIFGIGDPAWDDVLDDKVRVRFHFLVAGP